MIMPKTYARVLTIAGSDSGGGAGIQADLKTMSALGCFGMSAITAITAQNTLGVTAVYPMSIECVEQQIDAVLSDMGAHAVKIGMIWSAELAKAVSDTLKRYDVPWIVFDPVMVAQSGDALFKEDEALQLVRNLASTAHLITPNLTEAAYLLGQDMAGADTMERTSRSLVSLGCPNVLLKGGHLEDEELIDVLYMAETDETVIFREKRIATSNNHGTGCTLSSAVASYLAKGHALKDAVAHAKTYITQALRAGSEYILGKGHGPVHHFHHFWK